MSKETKWTPGHWAIRDNGSYFDVGPKKNNGEVNFFTTVCIGVMHGDKANAHLIAAAPELYEMLERILERYGREDVSDEQIEQLLAKARGEQ